MNKEFLKLFWKLFGLGVFALLMIKVMYEWTQGKQPENLTVIIILLMAIQLERR